MVAEAPVDAVNTCTEITEKVHKGEKNKRTKRLQQFLKNIFYEGLDPFWSERIIPSKFKLDIYDKNLNTLLDYLVNICMVIQWFHGGMETFRQQKD